ncbi:response regulator [Methanosarcina sp. KYL-1]|uniref:response regulator n=1 Tax=Methanosarcina sp. KYL-1 TaxID=2602068 RepID=UPI0021007468|nr:response regulator [Methanosarcina sp. KYL-1]MCQ1535375.1 response regulator [Methanosarcina sp. KYL-1]
MKSILVVEDNSVIMELVKTLLVSFGYEFRGAEDGFEAIKLIEKSDFNLILLDIQLPGLDGLEVLKILKENPETRQIPVIALTAHAMRGDEEKFLKAGCSGYVSKPIDIQRFKFLIEQFII